MRSFALIAVLLMLPPMDSFAATLQPAADAWQKVGFDQQPGAQAPLGLRFRDERGRPVQLSDYFGTRPVMMVLGYYSCKNLCSVVMETLLTALKQLEFDAGNEFDVVAVSIDPRETPVTASMKKAVYLQHYARAGAAEGLHLLTGNETAIKQLARAVGFRYFYDRGAKQFVHAAGVMVLTPKGRIARYFYGVKYPPRDLRFGLIEASNHKIGSVVDQILLLCSDYDPATGQYGFVIWRVLQAACAGTAAVVGASIFIAVRRERRRSAAGDRSS